MLNLDAMAAMFARNRNGYTLPQDLYVSREAYVFDTQVMLKSVWLFACTVAHVKNPGDWYRFDMANNSVIIVRGKDEEIRAFYNTCTHRGAQLCGDTQGRVPRFTCPYHSWAFGLDGKLMAARNMPDGFDKSEHGLHPVAIENVAGLLFICLADNPPPIDRVREDVGQQVGLYNLDRLKVAYQDDLIENANWKLTMENNRECYHCDSNHPELLNSLSGDGFGDGSPEDGLGADVAAFVALWKERGFHRDLIEFPDNWWHRVARLGLAKGAVSQTLDGTPASSKLIWDFDEPAPTSLSVWTHPNSWHHFCCDHAITFSVVPIAPDKTLLRTSWLVHEDAIELEDYTVENLTAVWRETNLQDSRLAEINHRGIATDGYRQGMYAREEYLVESFKNFYVECSLSALNDLVRSATEPKAAPVDADHAISGLPDLAIVDGTPVAAGPVEGAICGDNPG
ncbi:aromatic ring-hydroxylating oxygenase subunit alpha [Altererythrobacter sp.]|uniref:aromatic ring-hydroxylating oxygenase subunit alpha n=1 Tax=Altererythrobacter sp. TaxID=1872480 RepID=UPI003D0F8503